VVTLALLAFALSVSATGNRTNRASALPPPQCPFSLAYCEDKVPPPNPTCDPIGDPNCPPGPPDNPSCELSGCGSPVPVPCTGPNDPYCHIWPRPIAQSEDCLKAVYSDTVCPTAHAGVLGFDTGPIKIPIP
jgi:hypothetical protein